VKKSAKNPAIDFESTLNELNNLVEQMEQGGLTLEQSLQNFEKGITLVRHCQEALKNAEQKVQILVKQNGEQTLTSYHQEDE
jgi:exodeoxyribonuclease VII small subunit